MMLLEMSESGCLSAVKEWIENGNKENSLSFSQIISLDFINKYRNYLKVIN
jgi:hypothetical protein